MGRYSGTFSHKASCLRLDCIVDSGHRNPGPEVDIGWARDWHRTEKTISCLLRDMTEVLKILERSVFLPPCFLGLADSGTSLVVLRES